MCTPSLPSILLAVTVHILEHVCTYMHLKFYRFFLSFQSCFYARTWNTFIFNGSVHVQKFKNPRRHKIIRDQSPSNKVFIKLKLHYIKELTNYTVGLVHNDFVRNTKVKWGFFSVKTEEYLGKLRRSFRITIIQFASNSYLLQRWNPNYCFLCFYWTQKSF